MTEKCLHMTKRLCWVQGSAPSLRKLKGAHSLAISTPLGFFFFCTLIKKLATSLAYYTARNMGSEEPHTIFLCLSSGCRRKSANHEKGRNPQTNDSAPSSSVSHNKRKIPLAFE